MHPREQNKPFDPRIGSNSVWQWEQVAGRIFRMAMI
jgi:hypothetical protein